MTRPRNGHGRVGARLRQGAFLLPSAFTVGNLFLGFFAVILALKGRFPATGACILIAGVVDSLDGRIARMTHTESDFGKEFGVYVAAPLSTFDLTIASGAEIPIEERGAEELTSFAGVRTAPEGVGVWNPAFDVTPAELVTAIITERGVIQPVNEAGVRALVG